jgi:hypothetical protein
MYCTKQKIKFKYYVSGHYSLSCFYLKTPSCLYYKTQVSETGFYLRPQENLLSWAQTREIVPISGDVERIHLRNAVLCNINRTVFLDKNMTMDNVQKHNICTKDYVPF